MRVPRIIAAGVPPKTSENGFTLVELMLTIVLLTLVLLGASGGLIVMLTVARDTQGKAEINAERSVARPWLTQDIAALSPDPNGNWGTTSSVWLNPNTTTDPPGPAYPAFLPADISALSASLQPPGGIYSPDWAPGLSGCDGGTPEKCRDFVDNPGEVNDVWQSSEYRCDPDLAAPGGIQPSVGLFLIWSETWFGKVTDPTTTLTYEFDGPVSTQILYKLVRTPKESPTDPYRCDLVRETRYFPTPQDRARLASLGVVDLSDANLLAIFPGDSDIVARHVASADPTIPGAPPAWSEIKETRCDVFDPDAGGPILPSDPARDCRWRYDITLQLQPDPDMAPTPVLITASQRARTEG